MIFVWSLEVHICRPQALSKGLADSTAVAQVNRLSLGSHYSLDWTTGLAFKGNATSQQVTSQ